MLVPHLTPDDLRLELAQFHANKHRTLRTAFFGTGEAGQVRVRVRGEDVDFRVVPVGCELRFREVLSTAGDEPVALLVDYTERLPLDIQGRLAKGQLQFIGRERRLANLFGARAVSLPLLESPLADALLRDGRPFVGERQGATVDEHTAWRAFLQREAALSELPALTEALVVRHCAVAPAPHELSQRLAEDRALADATRAYLRKAAGPVAELAWCCWLRGDGVLVAAMVFVLEALSDSLHDGYVQGHLEGQLAELDPTLDLQDGALMARWTALAAELSLRLEGAELQRVIDEADQRVQKPKLWPHLAGGRYLLSALQAGYEQLAAVLRRAVGAIDGEGRGQVRRQDAEAAREAYTRLSQHRLADTPAQASTLERARMAVRLLAYLCVRPDWGREFEQRTLLEATYALAEHFAAEGGFVDYARRLARGASTDDALGVAIQRVVAAADCVRDAMDVHFARGLARWNVERNEGALLPIERSLDRLAVDFLQDGSSERRLLILVMDGMAWGTAVEMLLALSGANVHAARWKPKRTLPTGMPAPMVAALPTITTVSRAALFAGKLPRAGETLSTAKDPERLSEHRGFVKAFGQGPVLRLRTEAEDKAGNLTQEARELVRSADRAVAVVANAVDDMLSAKPSYEGRYNLDTIKALSPLLDEARAAGRAILLIADHGHVLSQRDRSAVKVEGADSPRYRDLHPGAPESPRELVLDGPNVYCAKKSGRLAMLYRESERYKDLHHLGEHGGAALSEVITPAVLLAPEELYQAVGAGEDEGLDTAPFPMPPWWQFELPKVRKPAAVAGQGKSTGKRKSTKESAQLDIFEPSPPVAAPEPSAAEPAKPAAAQPASGGSEWAQRMTRMFAKESKARREELKKRVLPALDVLLEHGGRMSIDTLAGKLEVLPRNLGGVVAIMAEFLNYDGDEVVRIDVRARQVELDIAMLEELFGEDS